MGGYRLDLSGSGKESMMGSGEHGNELSRSKQEIYCEAYWLF